MLQNPSKGRAVQRTGGGTTLDLRGIIGPESITAENMDGSEVTIEVAQQRQRDGWGSANHYMLEQDIETGDIMEFTLDGEPIDAQGRSNRFMVSMSATRSRRGDTIGLR